MSDNGEARRERYAEALYEDANPGFRWVDIPDSAADTVYWLDKAVAVMAVADEEQQRKRAMLNEIEGRLRKVVQENERLRRELTAANARQRATWALAQRRAQRIFDLQGEKGRLRDELEGRHDAVVRELDRVRAAWADLKGVELAVKAVFNEDPDADSYSGPDIRKALFGEGAE